MKIAMIHTPFLTRTGGERQILTLALELQKRGHQVEIFTNYADKNTYPELFSKLTVNVVPFDSKITKPLDKVFKKYNVFFKNYAYACPSMLALAKKVTKDFDIINNHNFPTEWAAFLAKNRLKIPVVWICNEPPFWYLHPQQRQGLNKFNWPVYSIFDKYAVKQVDEILALSNVDAKTIWETYHRSSRVVRSGVNVDFFHNTSGNIVRKKYSLENDFVLLQVGTLVYYKRQEDSITALAQLSKKHDNVKLILDGGGNQKPLIALAKELGVQDKIIFLHASSDEELAATYAACDVFLYPSDSTWGLVVVEAMAASKPIIISRKSGASEIIEDNITGFVVNHEKPMEIADRLELLINNPRLISALGDNCYHYVKKNLSWEKFAKDIENIFQQIIEHSCREN
jgi:glycosyltransferase involved in cell wall biosynthesis